MRKMRDILWYEAQEALYDCACGADGRPLPGAIEDEPTDAQLSRRAHLEERAEHEVAWFFEVMGGRVPDEGAAGPRYARPAAEVIARTLKSLSAFHRGALALRYTPREWPESLTRHYGKWTSLVVRLECVRHPTPGTNTTEEIERAAIERLESSGAGDLEDRADTHLELALHAYVKARGDTRAVLPPLRQRRALKKVQPIAASMAGGTNPDGPTLPSSATSEAGGTPALDTASIAKAAE
jgi:hypothetical protein